MVRPVTDHARSRGFVGPGVSALLALAVVLTSLVLPAAPAPAQAQQSPLPPGVEHLPDIQYRKVSGETLFLDAFVPTDGEAHPAIITMHGGSFRRGTRDKFNDSCAFFASNGYACFTIDYRLSPEYVYPAAVDDTKAAVEFVRENAEEFGVDTDRVALLGSSAGGTLAATVGAESTGDKTSGWEVAAAGSWSGGLAFTEFLQAMEAQGQTQQRQSSDLAVYIFGQDTGDLEGSEDGDPAVRDLVEVRRADPSTKLTEDSAAFFISISEEDTVPMEMQDLFVADLEELELPHEFLVVPGMRHGISRVVLQPTLEFFDEYVRDFEPAAQTTEPPTTEPPATESPEPTATERPRPRGDRFPVAAVALIGVGVLLVLALLAAGARRRGRGFRRRP